MEEELTSTQSDIEELKRSIEVMERRLNGVRLVAWTTLAAFVGTLLSRVF